MLNFFMNFLTYYVPLISLPSGMMNQMRRQVLNPLECDFLEFYQLIDCFLCIFIYCWKSVNVNSM